MVNLILAIIISALIGFAAGHFSAPAGDPAPVSIKEAVTGEVDAPPPQFNLPRPPGTREKKSVAKPIPELMCEKGMTIQQQLARLRFNEIQTLCREAEGTWQKNNMDSRAPFPEAREFEQSKREVGTELKAIAKTSAYWRGETTIELGETRVRMEVFTQFYPENGTAEMCFMMAPFFQIDGKALPAANFSMCQPSLRKRGSAYVLTWQMFSDPGMAELLSAALISLPGATPELFEYLDSDSGEWTAHEGFRWRPATAADYAKKVEDSAR